MIFPPGFRVAILAGPDDQPEGAEFSRVFAGSHEQAAEEVVTRCARGVEVGGMSIDVEVHGPAGQNRRLRVFQQEGRFRAVA